jgi:HPt (histidine-containing phosphotransfer) domain-containing protein
MTDEQNPKPDPIPSELAQRDEAFVAIVEEFVQGLARRVAGLSEALNDRDFQTFRDLAHQLKGSASGYGYPSLTAKAAELELCAAAAELEPAQAALKDLETLIARVVIRC